MFTLENYIDLSTSRVYLRNQNNLHGNKKKKRIKGKDWYSFLMQNHPRQF